jgi:two-component system, cell cycle sensor histidine kinase and response regulator CckA
LPLKEAPEGLRHGVHSHTRLHTQGRDESFLGPVLPPRSPILPSASSQPVQHLLLDQSGFTGGIAQFPNEIEEHRLGSSFGSEVRRVTGPDKLGTTRVLMLENQEEDADAALRSLVVAGLSVESEVVRTEAEFKKGLITRAYDIIICDFNFPDWNGLAPLRWVRRSGYDTPFIYLSGAWWDDIAFDCIREGATDYVLKNNLSRLPHAIRCALEERRLRQEHKRLEQERQESEKQYRLLFEANPQPMWVYDRRTLAFLAVNDAAIRHYGYSREEFLGMTILDIQAEQGNSSGSRTGGKRATGKVARDPEGTNVSHRKKDGSVITVQASRHEVSFRGVDAMLVLAHDITEILRNEQKLQQMEQRFAIAFRASPMAVTISTEADGKYIDANEAFLRMIGRTRGEVVGHTSSELNVWETLEDRTRIIRELNHKGAVRSFEAIFNSRSRGPRSVQVSAEQIQLDGVPCVLAITNDVTEEKALEEQLRQSQKMEAVGRLAGGVAHDFNNMLGVIMGYCDLAESRADRETVDSDVAHIKKAAQRAAGLTSQLLAFSRQQVLRPSVLNLNEVVTELLSMLHRVIAANVELQFQPSTALGNVKADASQIEQILINLVVNAGDAMPQGGKIIIETADLELDDAYTRGHPRVQPGPYVVLSVNDTGCGMSSETLLRIFEPFFTTKSPGEGTGLGLAMVYGAMQQSGGHIAVYSEEGEGTAFRLYFPRVEEEVEMRPAAAPDTSLAPASETVLLVEDESALREMTAELLRGEGYTVLEAADGPTAIAQSSHYEKPIHILLTDVVLPGLNGREVASRISAVRPQVKVVYISGYTAPSILNQGLLDSSVVLLSKPFTRIALLRQLRAILDRAA